jgi:hypothetical protein
MTEGLYKFGFNSDVDGIEDIWDGGGAYPFPAAAATTTVVSNSTQDITAGNGAITLSVDGLDANYMPLTETATLNGTGTVTLDNQFLRVFRMKVETAGSSGVNVGTITCAHGATTIAQIGATYGQTLMAVYTIPASYSHAMWGTWDASVTNYQAATSATLAFQVRPFGGAWNTKSVRGISSDGGEINQTFRRTSHFQWYLKNDIFEAKTDIRVRALAVTKANMGIASGFELGLRP